MPTRSPEGKSFFPPSSKDKGLLRPATPSGVKEAPRGVDPDIDASVDAGFDAFFGDPAPDSGIVEVSKIVDKGSSEARSKDLVRDEDSLEEDILVGSEFDPLHEQARILARETMNAAEESRKDMKDRAKAIPAPRAPEPIPGSEEININDVRRDISLAQLRVDNPDFDANKAEFADDLKVLRKGREKVASPLADVEVAPIEELSDEDLELVEGPEVSANPVGIFNRDEVLAAAEKAKTSTHSESRSQSVLDDEKTRVIRRSLRALPEEGQVRVPERPIKIPETPKLKVRPEYRAPEKPKVPKIPELPGSRSRSAAFISTPAVPAPPFTNRAAIGAPPVPKKESVTQKISAWWDRNNPFKKAA
jgi:hypothetical protein